MTDQSKAHLLPDNFLSLFNYPPQEVPAAGVLVQPQAPIAGMVPVQVPIVPSQTFQPAQGQVTLPVAPHVAAAAQIPLSVPALQAPVAVAPVVQPPVASPPVQQVAAPQPFATPLDVSALLGTDQAAGHVLQTQLAQAQAENTQLRATQQQQVQATEDARIAALPKTDQVLAQLELLKQQQVVTAARATEWYIEAEKQKILQQHGNEISEGALDTRSMEALQASVPGARQAYAVQESHMFQKFARQMGLQQQVAVEGLPPAPNVTGLPSSNNAGAVPSLPAGAQVYQPMAHPQLSRDNVYNYAQAGAGRVFQPQGMSAPQPDAQGNYFQPTYPQPGQYPAVVQQPQVMQTAVVPNNVAAMQMAQQFQPAPTPDPNMRADGSSPGRALQPAEAHSAVAAAQASIQASRLAGTGGARAMGMRESMTNMIALQGGGHVPQSLPIPTGMDRARMHPQYLAGARV